MSKFDALEMEVDIPSRMTILHPVTRQPLKDAADKEAYIDILSPDSEAARKLERKITNERLARARKSRANVTAEELEADQYNRLAAVTAGWYLLSLNGEPLDVECTPANARALYENRRMSWLRQQVETHYDDSSNFTQGSSKTS